MLTHKHIHTASSSAQVEGGYTCIGNSVVLFVSAASAASAASATSAALGRLKVVI